MESVNKNAVVLMVVAILLGSGGGYLGAVSTFQPKMNSYESEVSVLSLAVTQLENESRIRDVTISGLESELDNKDEEIASLENQLLELRADGEILTELVARARVQVPVAQTHFQAPSVPSLQS